MQGLLTFFQKRLLTTFPGRAERRKRKKTRSNQKKSYPIRPMTSKLRHIDISATSSRRIDVSTTLFWRPTPTGMLLKKSKPNRTWRPINVDARWFTSHRCRYNVILPFLLFAMLEQVRQSIRRTITSSLLLIDCLTDSTDYTLFAI